MRGDADKYDLLMIDGRHLLHRAAHSYQELMVKGDGGGVLRTGAVYGWLRIALAAHLRFGGMVIVAWDNRSGPSERRAIYEPYKARGEMDEAAIDRLKTMAEQEEVLQRLLGHAGIRQAHAPGWEADDVIATVATNMKTAAGSLLRVGILSGDRDFIQIVDDHNSLLRPLKKNTFDVVTPESVRESMGIKPQQILDVKALAGDSSDNIPGVAGIGQKRALELVVKHGSWRDVLGWSSDTEPRTKWERSLRESHSDVAIFASLVKLNCDAPLIWRPRLKDERALRVEMSRLRFQSLLSDDKQAQICGMATG